MAHPHCRILFTVILVCIVGVQSAHTQIPTPEVAAEAIQLNERLRTLPDRIVSDETLADLEKRTKDLAETTLEKARQTQSATQSGAIFVELQQSTLDWNRLKNQVESLSQVLTKHATALEQEIQSLRNDESLWRGTNQTVRTQKSPRELVALTGKAVADIRGAVQSAEGRRSRIVALQQSVATQSSTVATEVDRLKKAIAKSQRSLLDADSLPLWQVQFGSGNGEGYLYRSSYTEDIRRLKTFVSIKRRGLFGIAVLTIMAAAFFVYLQHAPKFQTAGSDVGSLSSVVRRPISLALFVCLVGMMPLLYDAPNIVVGLAGLIGVVPVTKLLKPRLSKTFQRMLVASIASVFLWHFIKVLQISTWIKRDIYVLFNLLVIGLFVWLARKARRENLNRGLTVPLVATFGALFVLLIAVFANVFGYVGLADLLTQGTLVSGYRALIFCTIVVIGSLIIGYMLQTARAQRSTTVRKDRERLARRLTSAVGVTMLVVWIDVALNLFTIRGDVYSALRIALDYQIKIGSIGFTLSNILAFVLTLVIGYLVASITRTILGEEILSRLNLASGLSNAVATVTHYVVLFLVFLLALAAAGVELSKFAILTGALGVGLGFGLQNIVNNFVSGLILLFERPVRVGDFLEVGGIGGQVSKIGVRSSTLHAFDGSDLIIPNASLISEQVVNWTLSDTRRRILLDIPVAYGNDPTHVRDLLLATVAANHEVLNFPGPMVFFTGFGDSALNFQVLFWAARPEVAGVLKSDVALSIAAALREAGITLPMPQRILQIKRVVQRDGVESGVSQEPERDRVGDALERSQGARS
jgi:potassium efflux system protein